MLRVPLSFLLLAVVVAWALAPGQAARADGWWPFTSGSNNTTTTTKPPIFPKRSAYSLKPPPKPSALEQLGTGTKKFFAGAKELVVPSPKTSTTKLITNPYVPHLQKPQPEQKSWWQNTFGSNDPPPGPKTPRDFIGGERPK